MHTQLLHTENDINISVYDVYTFGSLQLLQIPCTCGRSTVLQIPCTCGGSTVLQRLCACGGSTVLQRLCTCVEYCTTEIMHCGESTVHRVSALVWEHCTTEVVHFGESTVLQRPCTVKHLATYQLTKNVIFHRTNYTLDRHELSNVVTEHYISYGEYLFSLRLRKLLQSFS